MRPEVERERANVHQRRRGRHCFLNNKRLTGEEDERNSRSIANKEAPPCNLKGMKRRERASVFLRHGLINGAAGFCFSLEFI